MRFSDSGTYLFIFCDCDLYLYKKGEQYCKKILKLPCGDRYNLSVNTLRNDQYIIIGIGTHDNDKYEDGILKDLSLIFEKEEELKNLLLVYDIEDLKFDKKDIKEENKQLRVTNFGSLKHKTI